MEQTLAPVASPSAILRACYRRVLHSDTPTWTRPLLNLTNVNNKIGVSIPLPNGTQVTKTGGATYSTIYNTPTDSDEYLAKYDESIGNKDHVGVTYFFINTKSTPSGGGNVNWTGVQSAAAQTNANISDVHTFSPNLGQSDLAHVHAGHGRTHDDPCDRPGQPNPRQFRLELPHPGTGRTAPTNRCWL